MYENTSYWPAPFAKRNRPDWRNLPDDVLVKLLDSVYTALENDLRVLAAIGMRTVFDRASEYLGVDPDKSFAKKFDQLFYDGHIGASEKGRLEALTNAGGAAAHRGWEPDLQQLEVLTSIMEHFVRSLILKVEAGTLKQAIPPRYKRSTANNPPSQLIEFPSPKAPKTS